MVCDIQYVNCPRRIVIHFAWTLVQWIASLLLERRSAFEDGQHTKTIPGLCLFRNCSLKIGSHFSLITFNSRCLKSNFLCMLAARNTSYLIKRLVKGISSWFHPPMVQGEGYGFRRFVFTLRLFILWYLYETFFCRDVFLGIDSLESQRGPLLLFCYSSREPKFTKQIHVVFRHRKKHVISFLAVDNYKPWKCFAFLCDALWQCDNKWPVW